jgi:hypothetical protein
VTAIKSLLRLASTIACAILIVSFGLFAIDEARGGSKRQADKVAGIDNPAPSAESERQREKRHGSVREAIDDANDVLIDPFSGIVTSGSIWAKRGVATLIALLVYGVLLRILIGYLPGRR